MRLHFGDCVFDSDVRALLRQGEDVHLSPKAFRLLEMLLESRPKPLSKKALMKGLWPDACVTEGNLTNLVLEVRSALGDDARHPRYLRTVHRFGYSFCGQTDETARPSMEADASSRFRVVGPEVDRCLHEGENRLGRGRDCDVRIPSITVSRHHARIVVSDRAVCIEDLGSKNGTYVRGRRIEGTTSLQDGDRIRIGSASLVFRVVSPDCSTETLLHAGSKAGSESLAPPVARRNEGNLTNH